MEESVERGPRMGGMQQRNETRLENLHGEEKKLKLAYNLLM